MQKIAIVLMVLTVVLAGCAQDNDIETPGSPYLGGTQGIVPNFEEMGIFNENTNTDEIFENETFPIEVTLKNKGEYEVQPGQATVTLLGVDLSDFSGIPDGELSNTESVEKVSEFNEEGGETTLDFTSGEMDAKYLLPLVGSTYDVSVFGKVVYYYETYAAVPKVCFKEDLKDDSICDIEESKEVFSSGAPIQVSSAIEKTAGTGKIAVEFEIENVGSGDVTTPTKEFDTRFDQLAFEPGDANTWECSAAGKINEARLDTDGKATIRCRLKEAMADNTLFTKELDLTLKYKYKEIIHEQVRIKKE